MAYDERLAQRIRSALQGKRYITEKKMFGGIAFLRKGLMFVGVSDAALMARVGKEKHADSLGRKHVREMDFTGKPMQGYVFVDAEGVNTEAQLRFWLDRCEQFVSTLPPKAAKP
ncbi:MAG: TfoX/Sxy family protein [Burkholderiaceae bacterium]|nr:TfoX/Sxy family protein [Burkholderiaceae bacterium]